MIQIELVYFSCPLIQSGCNRHDFRRLVSRRQVPKLFAIEARQAVLKQKPRFQNLNTFSFQ